MRTPKRILGYARVSSAEQALGTSLQDQQDVIRAHAQKRGVEVAHMYVEAESAVHERAERRVQVLALLADLGEGDLVLVDKIDRWSRDPEFTYRSVREILAKGAAFFAIGDNCDPGTSDGDSMLGLRIFFAREEHKRIKVRMVGTRKSLKDRGYYADGLAPWGYHRQTDKKGSDRIERNTLVVSEDDANLVRDAFRLCIAGHSIQAIADDLRQEKKRVWNALRNRIYLGEQKDGQGNWIQGRHPVIIDAKTFASAAQALERRRHGLRVSREHSETSTWWLRDLARCARCSGKMSAAYAGPKDARRYYYCCWARCTKRCVPVRLVEEQSELAVVARLVELQHEIASAKNHRQKPTFDGMSLEKQRERLTRRRSAFLEMRADGDITREELHERLTRLDAERTKLDALANVPAPLSVEQRRSALLGLGSMQRAWQHANPRERRAIAGALASAALLAAGQSPRLQWFAADELARRG